MNKPVIAIDVDDVLAKSTESLRLEVNRRLKTNLLPEHYEIPGPYWGYYEKVWSQHGLAGKVSLEELDPRMRVDQSHMLPYDNAHAVLKKLAIRFDLIVITARQEAWRFATITWIELNYPGIFSEVYFAGRKDTETPVTKGQLCKQKGVSWLIDDNAEHCESALEEGIDVVLFGEYGWNRDVGEHITRCRDWLAVGEYFDTRS
jgi:5'(3')-deoxyribonucleotidase